MQLSEVLATMRRDDRGEHVAEPSDEWRQGRTLYGGLTAGLCVEAARRELPFLPALRALQIAFVAPASGRLRLRPELLRQGRSAAYVAVDGHSDVGLCARATLTCGAARDSQLVHDPSPAPDVAAPEDCEPAPLSPGPSFLSRFDVRLAAGGLPFAGGEPDLMMWVRHRDEGALDPTVALVVAGDVLPPAVSAASRELRPVSSMTWSLEITQAPEPADWYLLRSTSERAADGYSVQTMGIWDRAGRSRGLGRQVVALF